MKQRETTAQRVVSLSIPCCGAVVAAKNTAHNADLLSEVINRASRSFKRTATAHWLVLLRNSRFAFLNFLRRLRFRLKAPSSDAAPASRILARTSALSADTMLVTARVV
jgi:hypothetical protein